MATRASPISRPGPWPAGRHALPDRAVRDRTMRSELRDPHDGFRRHVHAASVRCRHLHLRPGHGRIPPPDRRPPPPGRPGRLPRRGAPSHPQGRRGGLSAGRRGAQRLRGGCRVAPVRGGDLGRPGWLVRAGPGPGPAAARRDHAPRDPPTPHRRPGPGHHRARSRLSRHDRAVGARRRPSSHGSTASRPTASTSSRTAFPTCHWWTRTPSSRASRSKVAGSS